MKRNYFILIILLLLVNPFSACKKEEKPNRSPEGLNLKANLVKINPFTYEFSITAVDADLDVLAYEWDFGNGIKRAGREIETATFVDNQDFVVKVLVSDGKSQPAEARIGISTKVGEISIDVSKKFQTIEGFGGFGAQDVYWSGGPYTSARFVDDMINDLGITILRENMIPDIEIDNDNTNPMLTDFSKLNLDKKVNEGHATFNERLPHYKAMKAAGINKFIVSVWTPPSWMKWNNTFGNDTKDQTSAPPFTNSPNDKTNQLKVENYEEFAEACVAYIKLVKMHADLDVYAFSIQNEPRFSQFYGSCVYNGEALRDLIKVVGRRFRNEGLKTKLFLPEDVGWFDGIQSLTLPSINDAEARKYVDMVAVHGYAFDGVTAASLDAQTWQRMYNWGAPHNIPLWMTETSGFDPNISGAMKLSTAIYTALRFGNVSAWVFWTLSTGNRLDGYNLLTSSGQKGKTYYASKNFYRYIRPNAVRIDAESTDNEVLPLAFNNNGVLTVVLINRSTSNKTMKLKGTNLPAQFKQFRTSESEDCKEVITLKNIEAFILPPNSITTLFSAN
jgi:O-glycosyl hydrolase